jgi:hypothetical protein
MNYTVRVELHDASWDDYETLHAAMQNVGFSRTITSADGKKYQLPTAEYDARASQDATQVRQIGSNAAKATGRRFSVLVSASSQRAWLGLQQVS